MFTGASTADVAILLVDARAGVLTPDPPPRQHRRAARHRALVVCVNKMDLVDFDRGAVRRDRRAGAATLARRLGLPDLARGPDQRAARRQRRHAPTTRRGTTGRRCSSSWRNVDVAGRPRPRPTAAAGPVGGAAAGRRPRLYTGRLAAGTLAVGRRGRGAAVGHATTVTQPRHARRRRRSAVPPMSVTIGLADDIDVGRGDVLVVPPTIGRRRRASSTRRSAG